MSEREDFQAPDSPRRRAGRLVLLVLPAALLGGALLALPAARLLHRAPPPPPPPVPRVERLHTTTATVRPGSNVYTLLVEAGLEGADVLRLVEDFAAAADLTRCRPGEAFDIGRRPDGMVASVTYRRSPLEVFSARRDEDGWGVMREQVPCDRRLERIGGRIDSSLFGAVDALGEGDSLAMALIDVLAWDIDFAHESQPGDRFSLVVEKTYVDGRRIGYGPILAVEYDGPARVVRHFSLPRSEGVDGGPMDYFTAAGQSSRKSFLRSPLRFSRISSGFTHRRLHPVTGRVQPHYAIDYAAPTGTPVWAAADGTVKRAGWDGGGGRTVVLSHPGGYESFYLHLSSFARGLARGRRVLQKQVIGYVGSTGVATGPHLDYRLKKQGRFVNPLREEFPRAEPVPPSRRLEFERRVAWLQGLLDRPLPEGVALLEGETSTPPAPNGAIPGRDLTLRK